MDIKLDKESGTSQTISWFEFLLEHFSVHQGFSKVLGGLELSCEFQPGLSVHN
jgi:hypothetical protein